MPVLSFRSLIVLTLAIASIASAAGPTATTRRQAIAVNGHLYRRGGSDSNGGKVDDYGNKNDDGSKCKGSKGKVDIKGRTDGEGGDKGKEDCDDKDKGKIRVHNPTPSSHPKKEHDRRSLDTLDAFDLALAICPNGLYGCPIADTGSLSSLPASYAEWREQGFECVDISADLRACGGCSSLDAAFDCTTIDGADSVSCVAGACIVDSCLPGYTFDRLHNACI